MPAHAAGQPDAEISAADTLMEPAELTEEQRLRAEIYKGLKKYVHKKYPGKSEWAEIVEQYNPMPPIEDPSVVDLRPQNREPPPLDRVTIPVETDEKYRVTRKTKWMIKQLRSPLSNDVPAMLEQWVKTMYPRRSDWLDLLAEFKEEKDRDLMLQIFEFALLEDTFEVRSQDVTNILVKYINLERYDDVERVMEILDTKGFPPDFVVCTVLLDMYCKLKKLDKARGMFDRIRSLGFVPDVVACSKLIDFYCESGNPEAGEMLLSEIEDEKVHGTIDTYLSVMKGYGKLGQLSEACRIFQVIKGDPFLRREMDTKAYSALMDAYTHANMLSAATLELENLLAEGMVPEDQSVSLLIAAHEKKNHFHKAVDVLLKMESKAVRPGVETLTTLISWFGRLGLVDEAEILFKEIEKTGERSECHASANLYATYARAGLLDKAQTIFDSLKEKKVLLTDRIFEQMIQGLLDGKQLEEAQSMRDQMLSLGYTPSDEIERALLGFQTTSSFPMSSHENTSNPLENLFHEQ